MNKSGERLAGIKPPGRSCRRWQLNLLQLILRGNLHLGMLRWIRNPRRNQVAPFVSPNLRHHTGGLIVAELDFL